MYDQSAIENARHPILKWLGVAMGIAILLTVIIALIPLSLETRQVFDLAMHYIGLCIFVVLGIYLLIEATARSRNLKHGQRLQARVIHRQRKLWGNGSGGLSWRLTLRYEINGNTFEVTRSVHEEEYRRAEIDAMIDIAVRPAAPRRWDMVPLKEHSSTTVKAWTHPTINRFGAIAFMSLALLLIVSLWSRWASDAAVSVDVYSMAFATTIIALAGVSTSIQWWKGDGRIIAPILLVYVGFSIIAQLFLPGHSIAMKAACLVLWLLAVSVVIADAWSRSRHVKD